MTREKIYSPLAYLGALPFLACALLYGLDVAPLPVLGTYIHVALVYGLVIISFMAGTHWGLYLHAAKSSPFNLFVTSNLITIVAWLLFLTTGPVITLSGFLLGFLSLLWIDYRLSQAGLITTTYYKTRVRVSALVIASLGFLLFLVAS